MSICVYVYVFFSVFVFSRCRLSFSFSFALTVSLCRGVCLFGVACTRPALEQDLLIYIYPKRRACCWHWRIMLQAISRPASCSLHHRRKVNTGESIMKGRKHPRNTNNKYQGTNKYVIMNSFHEFCLMRLRLRLRDSTHSLWVPLCSCLF